MSVVHQATQMRLGRHSELRCPWDWFTWAMWQPVDTWLLTLFRKDGKLLRWCARKAQRQTDKWIYRPRSKQREREIEIDACRNRKLVLKVYIYIGGFFFICLFYWQPLIFFTTDTLSEIFNPFGRKGLCLLISAKEFGQRKDA